VLLDLIFAVFAFGQYMRRAHRMENYVVLRNIRGTGFAWVLKFSRMVELSRLNWCTAFISFFLSVVRI
jgi:hypothetical protein